MESQLVVEASSLRPKVLDPSLFLPRRHRGPFYALQILFLLLLFGPSFIEVVHYFTEDALLGSGFLLGFAASFI